MSACRDIRKCAQCDECFTGRAGQRFCGAKCRHRARHLADAAAGKRDKRNLEKKKAYDRARYARTIEKSRAKVAAWRLRNPEKHAAKQRRLRARRRVDTIFSVVLRADPEAHAKIKAAERAAIERERQEALAHYLAGKGRLAEATQ